MKDLGKERPGGLMDEQIRKGKTGGTQGEYPKMQEEQQRTEERDSVAGTLTGGVCRLSEPCNILLRNLDGISPAP